MLDRVVRVGGAWTTVRGRRLKVLDGGRRTTGAGEPGVLDGVEVGTGDGSLRLLSVQPEGKGPMSAEAWANGARLAPHERLGAT